MRWINTITAAAVLAVTAGLLLGPAPAESTEFMADRLVKRDGRVYRGSLYCKGDMWRIEHNNAGPVDVTIVRKDKGVVWLLMARTKRFKTLPLDPQSEPNCSHDLSHETARDHIGTEILEGHPTTVSEVTVREGEQDVAYYEWRAEDVQLPLRMARKDGAWVVQYKNLKVRRLSDQLFELPLHYRPLDPAD
jgi:hypothetical protein